MCIKQSKEEGVGDSKNGKNPGNISLRKKPTYKRLNNKHIDGFPITKKTQRERRL